MRDGGAHGDGGVVQPAVGIAVRAVQDHGRRPAPVRLPVPPHALDVAADSAGGDHDGLARDFESLATGLDRATNTGDLARARDERIDAMPESQLEPVAARMLEQPADKAVGKHATRAPDEMEARHGVAGRVQAALDPHRHRHEADAEGGEPVMDLGHAAFDIGPGPGARPGVFFAEFAEGEPVGQAELDAVLDAAAPLQRRAGKPEAAKSLFRLAAEILLEVAVEQDDAPSSPERLDRRDDARNSRAYDRDVGGMAI